MATFDLEWLRLLVEVYRTGSVSQAADHLGMSQANASGILGKLRRHFDDPLFCRTAAGMVPTSYGQEIYPRVQRSLEELDALTRPRDAFSPHDATATFRIGMTDISQVVVLPELLNHLGRVAPRLSVEVEHTSEDTGARLAQGLVDLAIGFLPHLAGGFYERGLFKQDFVCLVARRHPRVRDTLSRAAFFEEAHLVVMAPGTGHALVDDVLSRGGRARRVALKVPSFLGVARLVADTELLVVVPRRLGEVSAASEDVRLLDLPVTLPSFSVKLHWHERFHRDPLNIWMRDTLVRLMGVS